MTKRKGPGPERRLQTDVVKLARLRGWRINHQRPAQNKNGKWLTAIEGHAGFPDLILLRRGRQVVIELKNEGAYLSSAQKEWRDEWLQVEGAEYYVLRPKDWDSGMIEHILLRGPVENAPTS